MSVKNFSNAEIYSSLNEINEILDETGDYKTLIEELDIVYEDFIQQAANMAIGANLVLANRAADRIISETSSGDITKYLHNSSHKHLSYISMMWADGFLCRLILEERSGKTWPTIDKSILDDKSKKEVRGISRLLTKEFRKITKARAGNLLRITRNQKKEKNRFTSMKMDELFFNSEEKKEIFVGEAMWADGFITAKFLPFNTPENSNG
jgi:DNA polymerase III gamma/tau subunit